VVIDPTGKRKVVESTVASFEPIKDARPGWLQKLELDRSSGPLLDHRRSRSNAAAAYQITNPQLDEIAAT